MVLSSSFEGLKYNNTSATRVSAVHGKRQEFQKFGHSVGACVRTFAHWSLSTNVRLLTGVCLEMYIQCCLPWPHNHVFVLSFAYSRCSMCTSLPCNFPMTKSLAKPSTAIARILALSANKHANSMWKRDWPSSANKGCKKVKSISALRQKLLSKITTAFPCRDKSPSHRSQKQFRVEVNTLVKKENGIAE